MPIPLYYYERSGDSSPDISRMDPYGRLIFNLPGANAIHVEAFVRPGESFGLRISGVPCALDVEPRGDNTIIVKPRRG